MSFIVLLLGGGDLASGVALRLHRSGLRVAITELPQPLAVRRKVSFAEAVYSTECTVEGIAARKVTDPSDNLKILRLFAQKTIPVLVDPQAEAIRTLRPTVVVDARMTKRPSETGIYAASLVIGLGPGFTAGENCHAIIETNRGPDLGRVIWKGAAEADTGEPEAVREWGLDRVLRAPAEGVFTARAEICAILEPGETIAEVGGQPIQAPFRGVLRGLLHDGLHVPEGVKIGDLDPRLDPELCTRVSDKALSVGGGVLEAILSRADLRPLLWT
ncbi:MAG: EF2563 family selenium-dependent molybdenum hydroxylase system protein [Chloroflexota bacterium]|nr:MAG: EF2563 family selenium-dependent molybdenum hydroxylase system protein [Chloroflexota bacterium]